MKKTQPKRQRIPKRGPGVAELEKILKEQQDPELAMNPLPNNNNNASSLFHHHHHHRHSPTPSSLNPPRPPPPPPPPPLPPIIPSSFIPSWPHVPLVPNLEFNSRGAPLSEKAFFPTTLVEERAKSDSQMIFPSHFYPNIQSSPSPPDLQYYTSMVNYIPGSASSSASASSSSSAPAPAARLFHQIEHPSSQRSTNYNNLWTSPEEEKMVSAKRLRTFSVESHRDPNFHSKAPMFTNMTMKESSSSSSSSLEMNHTAFNLDPNMRGSKRAFSGQLMSSTKSSGSYQAEDRNFMALGSSSSTPHEFPAFNFLLSQENAEDSQQRGGGESASDYGKITLNSLGESNSKGSKQAATGSNKDADEAEGDGVDLELKL